MLNKREHIGEVSGTGVAGARQYQNGQYYDVDGNYLFSDPGRAAPEGEERKSMEQAEAEMQDRIKRRERGELVDDGPKKATPAAPQRPIPPKPQQPEPGTELTPEQQLMQMNVPQLQALMLEALKAANAEQPEDKRKDDKALKTQLFRGPGAKEKTVKWLVENTDAS